ncbi:hypothetical protein HPP92_012281 [Vanilla planifolia]|uniref:Uncharacterized protein n=1 Tax=Vanilla planifolia TaxID=51239 RepID=A0A835UXE1_VANPL|nr:hypothetical protein HPP92_012281 [Vanilla planifolia]
MPPHGDGPVANISAQQGDGEAVGKRLDLELHANVEADRTKGNIYVQHSLVIN